MVGLSGTARLGIPISSRSFAFAAIFAIRSRSYGDIFGPNRCRAFLSGSLAKSASATARVVDFGRLDLVEVAEVSEAVVEAVDMDADADVVDVDVEVADVVPVFNVVGLDVDGFLAGLTEATRYLTAWSSGIIPAFRDSHSFFFSKKGGSSSSPPRVAYTCSGWSGRSKGRLSSEPGSAHERRTFNAVVR